MGRTRDYQNHAHNSTQLHDNDNKADIKQHQDWKQKTLIQPSKLADHIIRVFSGWTMNILLQQCQKLTLLTCYSQTSIQGFLSSFQTVDKALHVKQTSLFLILTWFSKTSPISVLFVGQVIHTAFYPQIVSCTHLYDTLLLLGATRCDRSHRYISATTI